jgi:hypothetical protein
MQHLSELPFPSMGRQILGSLGDKKNYFTGLGGLLLLMRGSFNLRARVDKVKKEFIIVDTALRQTIG